MSKAKTKIDKVTVQHFLENNFDLNVSPIKFLKGGEVSQAFSFNSKNSGYVIRVTTEKYNGFRKDKYAFDNYSRYGVPMPEIIEIGAFNNFFFAISERVEGHFPNHKNQKEITKLMPNIVEILDLIHSVDISGTKGYGDWDSHGKGKDKSWKDVLWGYYQRENKRWKKRYTKTFFEKEVFDKAQEKLENVINTINNPRSLVHADYGFDNILTDGTKITGVIDWEHSKYGDFLYDVAWLEFWAPDVGFADIFKNHYKKTKKNIDNWDNRIISCICHFGIGALGFFATSEQKSKYDFAKNRLLHYIK